MIQRFSGGVGSCGCGCWLLVRVAHLPTSSDPGSLSSTLIYILVSVLSPPVAAPDAAPFLTLVLIPILVISPVPTPVPVSIPISFLSSLVPCFPLGNASTGRGRDLHAKPLATCRCHMLSTEMVSNAEWQCLVFYSASFRMWRISEPSFSPLALLSSLPSPSPIPFPSPSSLLLSFPYPLVPVPVPAPCVYVYVCVRAYFVIKLHITAQVGSVILTTLRYLNPDAAKGTYSVYTSVTYPEGFALPSLITFYSLDILGRHLLNQNSFLYVLVSFCRFLPRFPHRDYISWGF